MNRLNLDHAEVFAMIADERRGIADLVLTLTDEQLHSPSLVPTWTVRDVIGHLTLALKLDKLQLLKAVLLARGNFARAFDRLTWSAGKRPASELADILRQKAEFRFTPPGMGPEAPLTELLVHGLDLRRPLALARTIPEKRTRIALRFLTETRARHFVGKGWRDGLRFEATDLEWSHGSGELVRGTSDSLMLALTGRARILGELEGPGVETLRRRFAAILGESA